MEVQEDVTIQGIITQMKKNNRKDYYYRNKYI